MNNSAQSQPYFRNFSGLSLGLIACLLALLSVASVYGQGRPPRFDPSHRIGGERGPEPQSPGHRGGPPFDFLSSEMRFDNKVVKGAPFSATAVTESEQTLADGTRITRKASAAIYRDGEGRTRREMTLNSIGPIAIAGEAPHLVFIDDVVAETHYLLDQDNHTFRKLRPPRHGPPPRFGPPSGSQGKTEALGKKMIEGVEAEGTRSTITIPAGQIGNDRPLEIISERWESSDLQIVVLSKHNDPRIGETSYRLTNINRSEPAKSLFDLPSDYKPAETEGRERPFGPPPPAQRMKRPE